MHLVADTVDFVPILLRKRLRTVQDVVSIKDIHFGASVNYMLVPQSKKSSTVDSAQIFHAICLWVNLTPNMDRKVQ